MVGQLEDQGAGQDSNKDVARIAAIVIPVYLNFSWLPHVIAELTGRTLLAKMHGEVRMWLR